MPSSNSRKERWWTTENSDDSHGLSDCRFTGNGSVTAVRIRRQAGESLVAIFLRGDSMEVFMKRNSVLCSVLLATLMSADQGMAQPPDPGKSSDRETGRLIIWGRERDGLQAGAYLISSTGWLQPSDPIVVQFVLRNVSDEQKTVIVQSLSDTHPVLGEDNRIELNILGSSQQKTQHVLKPDEVLNRRSYRVVVSTEGLPPGKYNVTSNVAFWLSGESDPNSGSGLSHGLPIAIPIGDESSWQQPVAAEVLKPTDGIHWGKPVGGLVVGMKLKDGEKSYSNDATLSGDLFAKNVSAAPIDFEYEIPGAADWNMSVTTAAGESVMLDSVWYSGLRARITRRLKLAANESARLTGIPSEVTVSGLPAESLENHPIESPGIRILAEKTEFQPGDLPRLITSHGKYHWSANLTIRQPSVTDLTMVIGSSEVPFEVSAD